MYRAPWSSLQVASRWSRAQRRYVSLLENFETGQGYQNATEQEQCVMTLVMPMRRRLCKVQRRWGMARSGLGNICTHHRNIKHSNGQRQGSVFSNKHGRTKHKQGTMTVLARAQVQLCNLRCCRKAEQLDPFHAAKSLTTLGRQTVRKTGGDEKYPYAEMNSGPHKSHHTRR